MEMQEIYDTIMKHLYDQNAKSMDNSGCLYHSKDGLKCAIGCLIPDKIYKPEMEGKGIACLKAYHIEVFKYLSIEDDSNIFSLLYQMQSLHDNSLYPNKSWETEAKLIANNFGIKG